jgi:hypothetical protein
MRCELGSAGRPKLPRPITGDQHRPFATGELKRRGLNIRSPIGMLVKPCGWARPPDLSLAQATISSLIGSQRSTRPKRQLSTAMRQAIDTRRAKSNGQLGSLPERTQSRKFCTCAMSRCCCPWSIARPRISFPSGRLTFCGRYRTCSPRKIVPSVPSTFSVTLSSSFPKPESHVNMRSSG